MFVGLVLDAESLIAQSFEMSIERAQAIAALVTCDPRDGWGKSLQPIQGSFDSRH
jgi:hypothetical protein